MAWSATLCQSWPLGTEIPNQKIVRCDIAGRQYFRGAKKMTDGDFKMLTKTKLALAAALIVGTASAALANDSGENNMGGFVKPGSMDGVNPAYHPRWFPDYAAHHGNAGEAYGYAASPKKTHRATHEQTQDR
jgi:hypothetical protein